MRMIISPAKKMNVDTDSFAVEAPPRFLAETRRISYDMVIKTMYETGIHLNRNYRETSEGGLARLYSRRG